MFRLRSYPVDPTYSQLLEENSVDLMSAPLDAFDCGMLEAEPEEGDGLGDDDLQEIGEDEFDEGGPKLGKRAGNYTELEDTTLIRAWESVTLDGGVGNDQTRARYWCRIEDKYHKLMPVPSVRSLRSLQGRWDYIK